MGQYQSSTQTVNMKAFVCMSLLAVAAAAPAGPVLLAHHAPIHHAVVGGQASHQSVSTAHGEVRTLSQSKAFGATHSSVAQADNSKGLAEIQPSIAANAVGHAVHAPLVHAAPVHHAVHAAPVLAHAVHAAPVVKVAAPAYAPAPVVKVTAPAYHAPVKA